MQDGRKGRQEAKVKSVRNRARTIFSQFHIKMNDKSGKARDLFQKFKYVKGKFKTRLGKLKDQQRITLSHQEKIKRCRDTDYSTQQRTKITTTLLIYLHSFIIEEGQSNHIYILSYYKQSSPSHLLLCSKQHTINSYYCKANDILLSIYNHDEFSPLQYKSLNNQTM